jgi:hypothetical protein
MRASERGGATLVMLLTLPLLMAILSFATAVFYTLKAYSSSLHECRVRLLKAEDERLQVFDQLRTLNTEAAVLRKARLSAQGNPELLAAVAAKQALLAAQQRTFLLKANSRVPFGVGKLKSVLAQTGEGTAISEIHTLGVAHGIVADPPGDLTPDYVPAVEFEADEASNVSWKIWPMRLFPKWLAQIESIIGDIPLVAQCSATAEQKGKWQWRAVLNVDKPQLNSSSQQL